jgi:hypothetical protein
MQNQSTHKPVKLGLVLLIFNFDCSTQLLQLFAVELAPVFQGLRGSSRGE